MNPHPLRRRGPEGGDEGTALPAWIAGLPVYRLAQSFEHETRPRELRLVLILASDRELRRARLLRSLRLGALVAAAISAALTAAWMRPTSAAATRPAVTIAQTLSEHLERRPAMAAGPSRSGAAFLRLDEALLKSGDRGY